MHFALVDRGADARKGDDHPEVLLDVLELAVVQMLEIGARKRSGA
jgi:hypothetical protein